MGKRRQEGEIIALFETADRYGNVVSLLECQWTGHILLYHGEVEPYLDDIKKSIEDPHIISELDTSRYYYRFGAGKGIYSSLYLTTIVDPKSEGRISTALFKPKARKTEKLIWVDPQHLKSEMRRPSRKK